MTTSPGGDVADDIATVLQRNSFAWSADNYSYNSSLIFYMAALRYFNRKPLRDDEVQRKLIDWLEDKLDEVSEQVLNDAIQNIEAVIALREE